MNPHTPAAPDYRARLRKHTDEPTRNCASILHGPVRSTYEVAALLGCTAENVRQIERKAIWKLRRRLLAFYQEHYA